MEKLAQDYMPLIIAYSVLILFIWLLVKLVSCLWNCLFQEAPREQCRRIIALDTEMVGAGARGSLNMLARVSMVDQYGCFYDKYVKPRLPVTDYRTPYSGIRPEDLLGAEEYSSVQWEVKWIIEGCILVGHDLKNDLNILHLTHPPENTRDTAYSKAFRKMLARDCIQQQGAQFLRLRDQMLRRLPYLTLPQADNMVEEAISQQIISKKPSLKRLAKVILGRDIQVTTHSSSEDAQAAFDLYLEFLKRSGFKFDLEYFLG